LSKLARLLRRRRTFIGRGAVLLARRRPICSCSCCPPRKFAAFVRMPRTPFGRVAGRRAGISLAAGLRTILRSLRRRPVGLALRWRSVVLPLRGRRRASALFFRRRSICALRRRALFVVPGWRPVGATGRGSIFVGRIIVASAERNRSADKRCRNQYQSHDLCPHLERSPSGPTLEGTPSHAQLFRRFRLSGAV